MNTKWKVWSLAVALCLTAIASTGRAQESVPGGLPEVGAPQGEAGEPGRLEEHDEVDALDLLLAADVAPGPSGAPGARGARLGPGRGRGMGAGRRGAELREQLNLSDEQKSRLADIRDRQARVAIPIQGDLRIASLDLHKLMRADRPDRGAIDAQIDRIASLRASLHKNRVAGHLEARSVLTPAQQKIMREHGGGLMGRGLRRGHGPRMGHL